MEFINSVLDSQLTKETLALMKNFADATIVDEDSNDETCVITKTIKKDIVLISKVRSSSNYHSEEYFIILNGFLLITDHTVYTYGTTPEFQKELYFYELDTEFLLNEINELQDQEPSNIEELISYYRKTNELASFKPGTYRQIFNLD